MRSFKIKQRFIILYFFRMEKHKNDFLKLNYIFQANTSQLCLCWATYKFLVECYKSYVCFFTVSQYKSHGDPIFPEIFFPLEFIVYLYPHLYLLQFNNNSTKKKSVCNSLLTFYKRFCIIFKSTTIFLDLHTYKKKRKRGDCLDKSRCYNAKIKTSE